MTKYIHLNMFFGTAKNMLEEQGIVVAVEKDSVWIEVQHRTACRNNHCDAQQNCSTASISRLLGERNVRLKVAHFQPAQVGDRVTLGLEEQAILRGSLLLYLLPLVCLLSVASIYELLAMYGFLPVYEIFTMLAGFGGLLAGLLWSQHLGRQLATDVHYQPVILRIN